MLIKPITYTNFNGEKRTKNFYFNLTRTELAKMELLEKAGMEATIKQMIDTDDRAKIIELFEKIVCGAYGEKSPDGEEFLKSPEIVERFKCHPAYDVLFMELINSSENMANFISAVMPQDLADEVKKNKKSLNDVMGYDVIPGGLAGA